jgi:hypothetical protein
MLDFYLGVIILMESPSVEATGKLIQDEHNKVFKYDVICEWRIRVFGWLNNLRIEMDSSHNDSS